MVFNSLWKESKMSNPNRTVAAFRDKQPSTQKPDKQPDPFFAWFFEQVQVRGRLFDSIEEARKKFDSI